MADAALCLMTNSLPEEANTTTKQNEARWITLTVQPPTQWLCTFMRWFSSCCRSPEAVPFVFFKLFSGEPNEKSGFYPETTLKTFSCARGHSFMRTYYYFHHLERHHRQSIVSLSFVFSQIWFSKNLTVLLLKYGNSLSKCPYSYGVTALDCWVDLLWM